jgi:hypothetical protein
MPNSLAPLQQLFYTNTATVDPLRTQWMTSGLAIGPMAFLTAATSSDRNVSDAGYSLPCQSISVPKV